MPNRAKKKSARNAENIICPEIARPNGFFMQDEKGKKGEKVVTR